MTPHARLVLQTGTQGYGILGRHAENDLEGTLDAVLEAGYGGLEIMSSLLGDRPRLRDACAERGLELTALHLFWQELDDFDWSVLTELGVSRLILSGLPVASEEQTLGCLTALRRHSARARREGAQILLHNHAEEGIPLPGGSTPFEILAAETDEKEVGFVVDLHWAAVAGDTARMLKATAGRCDYLHIKDGLTADPQNPRSFDLGTGEVDLLGGWQQALGAGHVDIAVVERAMPAPDMRAALHHDADFVRSLFASRDEAAE
ncbi:sugar phosphate isomerase/epimerase [Streptomyces sp. NPDC001904]|uniref:sugar phosphate isomerase/epimerase family protein n=1 Tax=Streptomyces sp. NPDC001904 TaxID=3154531 RepID=UPI0033166E35